MKKLPPIRPTAEQLPLISDNSLGIEVIRGAAGSGKTSTAILRLRSLAYMLEERREREGAVDPVKMLVLTFNRTLSGYVRALVEDQISALHNTIVTIDTFGHWAMTHLGFPDIVPDRVRENKIRELASPLGRPSPEYVVKEVDYLMGRFPHDALAQYLTVERTGRGVEPRVERRRILEEVVAPYRTWLDERGQWDWNDVAVAMASTDFQLGYDVAIIDESQDFSANQLRALRHHIADEHAVTFVIDTVQRIYARGFTWTESGFDMRRARYHTLRANHRNTVEIAAFAAGLLEGLAVEADGTIPNLAAARTHGPRPMVLRGKYDPQAAWAIDFLENQVDLSTESVAFLKPQAGAFFERIRSSLNRASIPYVDITRDPDWPDGDENVALSTFHSAKGLEFDYVFILGLSHLNTAHGDASVDDQLIVLRRLLAVAVARARKGVVIGYKPGEESHLIQFFKEGTYESIDL
jgi:hypothetical protein